MCMPKNYDLIPVEMFEYSLALYDKIDNGTITHEEQLYLDECNQFFNDIDFKYFDVLKAPMPNRVKEKWGKFIRPKE